MILNLTRTVLYYLRLYDAPSITPPMEVVGNGGRAAAITYHTGKAA